MKWPGHSAETVGHLCAQLPGRTGAPLGILHGQQDRGTEVILYFNLYRSIKIEGTPKEGNSSGQAIGAMKQIFNTGSYQGLGFDWTGISREEVKAGSLAVVIFALGILAVFLVLSAQYESYSDPIILLTVPTHCRCWCSSAAPARCSIFSPKWVW